MTRVRRRCQLVTYDMSSRIIAFKGKVPTIGKLVGLTRKEIVIYLTPVAGASGGVTLHFSRGGFVVRPEKKQSKL